MSFSEKSFDESSHARLVADYFGTRHDEELLGPSDMLKLLPKINDMLDEPLADNSIVPTYALSKFTKRYVTVALGGDGGDELFAGYPTFQAERYASLYNRFPKFIKHGIIPNLVKLLPVSDKNISLDFKLKRFLKGVEMDAFPRHMVWLGAFSPEQQEKLFSEGLEHDPLDGLKIHERSVSACSHGNGLLYLYKKTYLAEDILCKVDRASMWTSLEVRSPFLDHELVEFVFRLPYEYKIAGSKMKYILKRAMKGKLPPSILKRPKKGFGTPIAKWIKGNLKDMACDLLSAEKIGREGIFNPMVVSGLLDDHLNGISNNGKELWALLVFENWLERWGIGNI